MHECIYADNVLLIPRSIYFMQSIVCANNDVGSGSKIGRPESANSIIIKLHTIVTIELFSAFCALAFSACSPDMLGFGSVDQWIKWDVYFHNQL